MSGLCNRCGKSSADGECVDSPESDGGVTCDVALFVCRECLAPRQPILPSSLAVNDVIEFTADDGTRSRGTVGLVDLVGCFIGDGWTCRLFDTAAERLAIKIVRRSER